MPKKNLRKILFNLSRANEEDWRFEEAKDENLETSDLEPSKSQRLICDM